MEISRSLLKMLRSFAQRSSPLGALRMTLAIAAFAALIFSCPQANAVEEPPPVLQVIVLEGGTSLDFGQLRSLDQEGAPLTDSSSRRVRLQVTHSGTRPFVLSQIVNREPVNQNGTQVPADAIRFRASIENGMGMLRTSQKEPLETGLQEIYDSDDNDQNVSILIVYDFLVPPGQKAGQYHASITYRVDVR